MILPIFAAALLNFAEIDRPRVQEVSKPVLIIVRTVKSDTDEKNLKELSRSELEKLKYEFCDLEFNGIKAQVAYRKSDLGLSSLEGAASLFKSLDHSADGSKGRFRLNTGSLTDDQRAALADEMYMVPGVSDAILKDNVEFDVTIEQSITLDHAGQKYTVKQKDYDGFFDIKEFKLPSKSDQQYREGPVTIHELVGGTPMRLVTQISSDERLKPNDSFDLGARALDLVSKVVKDAMADYARSVSLLDGAFDQAASDFYDINNLSKGMSYDQFSESQKRILQDAVSRAGMVKTTPDGKLIVDFLENASFVSSSRKYFFVLRYSRDGRSEGMEVEISRPRW